MTTLVSEPDDLKREEYVKRSPLSGAAALSFILLALLAIYFNSFTASWQFDDLPNIVENGNVQPRDLSWDSLCRAMQGVGKHGIDRPVAYVSFAVNYYVGGLDVFGYHLVNFLVHCLAALFLYLFIRRTLELPILDGTPRRYSSEIAFLATLFWACNPIQVSAVTYIVQRMACLGALFYVMALYFYLRARTGTSRNEAAAFYGAALLSALFAFGTKENTVTLPMAILLYDVLLIQGARRESLLRALKIMAIPMVLAVIYAAYRFSFATLLDSYAIRPFTLPERLLTEPRVILFYISLLLYPASSRFMMLHDFDLSRTLTDPWTTIPAILALGLFVGAGVFLGKKKPLVSFSILFFFLNHLIEGSFLPLEIIYTHRNYLPSMFFFVPPALWLAGAATGASAGKTRRFLLAGLAGMLFLASAVNVFLQNETYRDEITFWSDNVRKAPGLHRPHHNLARALTKEGRYDEALEEMNRALDARGTSFVFQKAATYGDRGELLAHRGDLEAAKSDYTHAIEIAPFFPKPYIGLTKLMMREARLDEALEYSRKSVELEPGSAECRVFHSMVLLRKGRLDEAGKSAAAALALRGDYLPAWLVLTELERKRGHRERARSLFEAVMAQAPSERAACDLLQNSYRYLYGQAGDISCEDGRNRLLAYYGGKSASP